MTQNKRECEKGFLENSERFYRKTGSYALQQTLKQRLEQSYGTNATTALEGLMTQLIESGKDDNNFCKNHQYKFGIGTTPMSEQLPKMDISLCSLLLLNAKDAQQNRLLTAKERDVICEIRDGRNDFGHEEDTSNESEEIFRPCWETSAMRLEKFTNTPTLMQHIPSEMQKNFYNYLNGRGSYIAPTKPNTIVNTHPTQKKPSSDEIGAKFAAFILQKKTVAAFDYLFQNANNDLLLKIYNTECYQHLMEEFLDAQIANPLTANIWKKKCHTFGKNSYKYAKIYASTLSKTARWNYLESYALQFPKYAIEIYELIYQENPNAHDRRRYDRARLALDSSIQERCIAQLAEHYQDLETISLENWLSHTENLQPILSLMSEEDQEHFRQKTLDAHYRQLGYNPNTTLSEQVEWFFHNNNYYRYKQSEFAQVSLFPSICEKFLHTELRSLTNALDTNKSYVLPKYFKPTYNSSSKKWLPANLPNILTTQELYKEWLHFYKIYCVEREIRPHVNFILNKARNLQKIEKSILNDVASMKPSLEKLKRLEDITKTYKADWQLFTKDSNYFEEYPMFTKEELIEQTGHSPKEYGNLVSSAGRISSEIYSSAEKLYKEIQKQIALSKKRKKIFLVLASVTSVCMILLSTHFAELKKAEDLYAEGKLIEAYKIYDKKSKINKDIEQKRIQCLAKIRQTMVEDGFRQDILSIKIDHSHDTSAMIEQGSYYTDRTDITLVASRDVPVYLNADGSYQILMGSYWGELRIPEGLELMAIWKSDRWSDKFCVSAICSDGTRLYGESEWITTGPQSTQIESNKYAAEQGMDLNISEETISIKDVILTSYEVYFLTTDNLLLTENATTLYENVAVVELAPYNEYLTSVYSTDGGCLAPISSSYIDTVEAKDIADYYLSSSYIMKDGRLVKDGQWQEENDWLFFDDDYTAISVYDASITEYFD